MQNLFPDDFSVVISSNLSSTLVDKQKSLRRNF